MTNGPAISWELTRRLRLRVCRAAISNYSCSPRRSSASSCLVSVLAPLDAMRLEVMAEGK